MSEILFSEDSYHIETSQLICKPNHLSGFCVVQALTEWYFRADVYACILYEPKHYLIPIVKMLKPIIKAMIPKIIFFIFLNFNFFIPVPYVPFVEAILESFEIICLNHQFLLIDVLKGFLASFKDVSKWRMEIENFHNSTSNFLYDCVL